MSMTKVATRLVAISVIVWLLIVFCVVLSKYEGEWFPVISQFELTSISSHESRGPNWSVISGQFVKTRNCVYKGIEWYYVGSSGDLSLVQVQAMFEDKPQVRASGEHNFKRLVVRLDNELDINHSSMLYAVHDCHNGWLWNTKTLMHKP